VIAGIRLARRYIDLCALRNETFGNHFANAARSAGYQRNPSGQREKILCVHLRGFLRRL
jgi:hypothetical protein